MTTTTTTTDPEEPPPPAAAADEETASVLREPLLPEAPVPTPNEDLSPLLEGDTLLPWISTSAARAKGMLRFAKWPALVAFADHVGYAVLWEGGMENDVDAWWRPRLQWKLALCLGNAVFFWRAAGVIDRDAARFDAERNDGNEGNDNDNNEEEEEECCWTHPNHAYGPVARKLDAWLAEACSSPGHTPTATTTTTTTLSTSFLTHVCWILWALSVALAYSYALGVVGWAPHTPEAEADVPNPEIPSLPYDNPKILHRFANVTHLPPELQKWVTKLAEKGPAFMDYKHRPPVSEFTVDYRNGFEYERDHAALPDRFFVLSPKRPRHLIELLMDNNKTGLVQHHHKDIRNPTLGLPVQNSLVEDTDAEGITIATHYCYVIEAPPYDTNDGYDGYEPPRRHQPHPDDDDDDTVEELVDTPVLDPLTPRRHQVHCLDATKAPPRRPATVRSTALGIEPDRGVSYCPAAASHGHLVLVAAVWSSYGGTLEDYPNATLSRTVYQIDTSMTTTTGAAPSIVYRTVVAEGRPRDESFDSWQYDHMARHKARSYRRAVYDFHGSYCLGLASVYLIAARGLVSGCFTLGLTLGLWYFLFWWAVSYADGSDESFYDMYTGNCALVALSATAFFLWMTHRCDDRTAATDPGRRCAWIRKNMLVWALYGWLSSFAILDFVYWPTIFVLIGFVLIPSTLPIVGWVCIAYSAVTLVDDPSDFVEWATSLAYGVTLITVGNWCSKHRQSIAARGKYLSLVVMRRIQAVLRP